MLQAFKAATEVGNYDDVPVLPQQVDPQVHLSRNRVPQPFFLICEKDTVLAQMTGEARLQLKNSSVNTFTMRAGDNVYVPAGTPHRVLPESEVVQLRYRAQKAGLEGVAWYCPGCDRELHRVEWDTAETVSQQAWHGACTSFNADDALRECGSCGARHARIDMTEFQTWLAVAVELAAEREKATQAGASTPSST
jgi:3-hydroxyanthranilate 3,4-dioxygenase